jgi:cytochrome c oxidase subunit 1
MHFLGLMGMPRRIYTYQPELPWAGPNLFVSLSAGLLAAGFLLFFVNLVRSAVRGAPAGPNPWGASTLEWATTSPPPAYNFAHIPVVSGREPLWEATGDFPVAGGLRSDRRELLVSSLAAAEPQARESSPRNSIWPLFAALATTALLIGSIFSPWVVVWGSIPVAAALVGWFWPKDVPEDEA